MSCEYLQLQVSIIRSLTKGSSMGSRGVPKEYPGISLYQILSCDPLEVV